MDQLASVSPATTLILKINSAIVNPIILLMFACALVAFLWGVMNYVTKSDDTEARQKGSQHIMWGIIGMALMIMAFGIEKVVIQTFGINKDSNTINSINQVLK